MMVIQGSEDLGDVITGQNSRGRRHVGNLSQLPDSNLCAVDESGRFVSTREQCSGGEFLICGLFPSCVWLRYLSS